ncbi:hypothetical protein K4F52_007391 [Lecanicillium sp. MT-2017a]|nr:hypothetical protein K4F52_007391 [Lecanicillium sp. MT-2017a]
MQLSLSIATLALAASVAAGPSGTSDGSIFMFGDSAKCRKIFYDSGACGLSTYFKGKVDPNMSLVAIPSHVFDKYGQAQNNKLCGKIITMTYQGVTRKAVVADENTSGEQSIDMCLGDWKAFHGKDGDGTLRKNIKWSII